MNAAYHDAHWGATFAALQRLARPAPWESGANDWEYSIARETYARKRLAWHLRTVRRESREQARRLSSFAAYIGWPVRTAGRPQVQS